MNTVGYTSYLMYAHHMNIDDANKVFILSNINPELPCKMKCGAKTNINIELRNANYNSKNKCEICIYLLNLYELEEIGDGNDYFSPCHFYQNEFIKLCCIKKDNNNPTLTFKEK